MELDDDAIRRLLDGVRSRYRALELSRAVTRAALAVSAVVVGTLSAHALAVFTVQPALAVIVLDAVAVVVAAAAVVWAVRPLRARHADRQIARFVEERVPALDDRLATAVDVVASESRPEVRPVAVALLKDASRRAAGVHVDEVIAASTVRRGRMQASAAMLVLIVLAFVARGSLRQSVDAASLALFPARVSLEVSPGDARLKQGATLQVEARLLRARRPSRLGSRSKARRPGGRPR